MIWETLTNRFAVSILTHNEINAGSPNLDNISPFSDKSYPFLKNFVGGTNKALIFVCQ